MQRKQTRTWSPIPYSSIWTRSLTTVLNTLLSDQYKCHRQVPWSPRHRLLPPRRPLCQCHAFTVQGLAVLAGDQGSSPAVDRWVSSCASCSYRQSSTGCVAYAGLVNWHSVRGERTIQWSSPGTIPPWLSEKGSRLPPAGVCFSRSEGRPSLLPRRVAAPA